MLTGIVTIAGLLVLRVGVPLVVTLALAAALRRINTRWNAGRGNAA